MYKNCNAYIEHITNKSRNSRLKSCIITTKYVDGSVAIAGTMRISFSYRWTSFSIMAIPGKLTFASTSNSLIKVITVTPDNI